LLQKKEIVTFCRIYRQEVINKMFVYNAEDFGEFMIYDRPTESYKKEEITIGNHLVSISETDAGKGRVVIQVFENSRTTQIISNVEMNVDLHKTDNYYSVTPK
jgi:hypothetical protein